MRGQFRWAAYLFQNEGENGNAGKRVKSYSYLKVAITVCLVSIQLFIKSKIHWFISGNGMSSLKSWGFIDRSSDGYS